MDQEHDRNEANNRTSDTLSPILMVQWKTCSFWKATTTIGDTPFFHLGVSKNSGIPKWMVYNGKPYQNGWFGGTTIFGNIHFLRFPCCTTHLLPGVFKETPLLSGFAAGLGIFFSHSWTCWEPPVWVGKKKPNSTECHGEFSAGLISTIFFWAAQHIPGWILYFSLYLIFFWGGK